MPGLQQLDYHELSHALAFECTTITVWGELGRRGSTAPQIIMATWFLLHNIVYISLVFYSTLTIEREIGPSFWQITGMGETFPMFCLFVIGMGILSYGLAAYQIFPGREEDQLTENNDEEAEVEEVQAAPFTQELENVASGSGMNAISSNTMGPQVLAVPGSMDMNISESDLMKFISERMQDFESSHSLDTEPPANVDIVEATLSCNVCEHRCKTDKILSRHINTKHKGCRECSICEIMFSSEDSLNARNTGMHTDGELYDAIVRTLEQID